MSDAAEAESGAVREQLPFGAAELLSAVAGAGRVLDLGCGSGRLTVALAWAGATVTGIDTSRQRLDEARRRARKGGVELQLLEADMDEPLPFEDGSFDAATSRLALMAAAAPTATLRELRRVVVPDGRIATLTWASLDRNPWFSAAREAIAAVLGDERACFARAFGKLGDPAEAADVHRAAGLRDVESTLLREHASAADAAEHWERLTRDIGHFRRAAETLTEVERKAVIAEVATRLEPYRTNGSIQVPRTVVLVTARH
ncbi:MAG TPA: class I SAM-dependent methyltransferase [Gaiellaceae bacterium]|nr:class I SAM-dependent methyltransferase [Gaiellaceae bacterium]